MSGCFALGPGREPGLAVTLRQVDCIAAQTGGGMFERLFGLSGTLGSVLTIALTIYVAWLAIGMLTGRSALKLSTMTPRMLGLGMILTLSTSWVAYQTVVWALLTGAPDQIAGALLGTRGSATLQFASRLDSMFTTISTAAQAGAAAGTAQAGAFGSNNLLWTAALLLLFGSLGVLLVARIALITLLGLGPLFMLFGLFRGTRGLLDGWIKAAVMFSIAQLLSVLIGGEALALLSPVVGHIAVASGNPTMHDGVLMLLASGVFVTLMVISLASAAMIVARWSPLAFREGEAEPSHTATHIAMARQNAIGPPPGHSAAEAAPVASDRTRISGVVAAVGSSSVVRTLGAPNTSPSERLPPLLPYQGIVAHNRRSGDRLREPIGRRASLSTPPARTLFQ